MANPNKQDSQLADKSDNALIGSQQSLVADAASATAVPLVITFTANTPTPSATQTIADGTVPTVAELGQYAANQELVITALTADVALIRTALNAALDVLEAHGLMSDA
jgi:hypothetical protein